MSVIIRLQNLPWSANALDIRQYFHGLSIPEGGVHIVGGELGDAFIAFSTDEDARQAFNRNNGKIKEVQISLMLSSRTEMQRVIEAARTQSFAAFMQTPAAVPVPAAVPQIMPAVVPDVAIKSDSKDREGKTEKRDRRRSRSRSRERNRSRERERRRHRDRSRSRSRERRDRRRRGRSRSRDRTERSHSKDQDRKKDRKRSDDRSNSSFQRDGKKSHWSKSDDDVQLIPPKPPSILGSANIIEEARKNLLALNVPVDINGLQSNSNSPNSSNSFNNNNRNRESWPPNIPNRNQQNNFPGRQNNFQNQMQSNFPSNMNQNQMFHNNRNMDDNGGGGNLFENRNRNRDGSFCVKVEPFWGGYGDIRRFFHGMFISNKGIKFINDSYGKRTGIVYVQFVHEELEALERDGDMLNGTHVCVAKLSTEEFERAIDRFVPDRSGADQDDKMVPYQQDRFGREYIPEEERGRKFNKNRTVTKFSINNKNNVEPEITNFSCLIVDDLPTYVKEQDILKLFSTHPLISLFLTIKLKGGHIAYVKFSSAEEAEKALEETASHIVCGKAVTVKPCTDEDFEAVNQQHNVDIIGTKKSVPLLNTDCLVLTQLPPKTNDRDIADFFSDVGVVPLKIHLMNNDLGFTGTAFCEFPSIEDATTAIKKHDTVLGSSIISIHALPRIEMEAILNNSIQSLNDFNINDTRNMPNNQGEQSSSMMQQPMINPLMMQRHQLNPQQLHNQNPMMNRPFFPPRNNNFDGGRGGFRFQGPRGQRPRFNAFNPNNAPDDAPPGCSVFMDNVPYKAGTNEILDFFDGYGITNNVCRRYNPNNTPSAEAKVVFKSPDEAFRAVQEKNGQKIWDRSIYLKQH